VAAEFSLLLPVYRGDDPDHFEHAFRSCVEEQSVRPAEAVIVQDGPIPEPLRARIEQCIERSPVPVTLVALARNLGLAGALQEGLERCRYDIVARMDADDVSLPERFAKQLPLVEAGADLVGTGMFEFVNEIGTIVAKRTPPVEEGAIARYARFHDPFNHPTVVYRKSAVARAGGYLDIGPMEDYWLFVRMIQTGARVANVPDPLVLYRVGAGAYARRGGLGQLRAELAIQREFRRIRFTSRAEFLRNVAMRGVYRLIPEILRKFAYRRVIARRM
jgi:hypothetical protein